MELQLQVITESTRKASRYFNPMVSTYTTQKDTIHHHASHLWNVLFPGHNHLLTIGADDLTLDYHPSASEGDN